MAADRMTRERNVPEEMDPVCDGFHINPHLVITVTVTGEYEVSAPWTDFTARGETEQGAVHAFTQGWKQRLLASEADRAAVVAFMAAHGYVPPYQRDGSRLD
jgi:hypothetical protein